METSTERPKRWSPLAKKAILYSLPGIGDKMILDNVKSDNLATAALAAKYIAFVGTGITLTFFYATSKFYQALGSELGGAINMFKQPIEEISHLVG